MADDTKTLFYTSAEINSIKTLETTCNTDEFTFKRKLQSLDTVSVDGKKATEAVYKRTDKKGLGKLTIEKCSKEREDEALFKGKAFVLTQSVDVLVFRG
jgi:hypothetical protein